MKFKYRGRLIQAATRKQAVRKAMAASARRVRASGENGVADIVKAHGFSGKLSDDGDLVCTKKFPRGNGGQPYDLTAVLRIDFVYLGVEGTLTGLDSRSRPFPIMHAIEELPEEVVDDSGKVVDLERLRRIVDKALRGLSQAGDLLKEAGSALDSAFDI